MNVNDAIAGYLKFTGNKEINISTALVDMDGVLYDSMKNHTRAWVKLMKKNGIKCTRDEFYLYEGMTGEAIIQMKFKEGAGKNITHDEATALYKVKGRYFQELGEAEIMPGTLDVLKGLKAAGVRCNGATDIVLGRALYLSASNSQIVRGLLLALLLLRGHGKGRSLLKAFMAKSNVGKMLRRCPLVPGLQTG